MSAHDAGQRPSMPATTTTASTSASLRQVLDQPMRPRHADVEDHGALRCPSTTSVSLASSATGRSLVPAVTIATRPALFGRRAVGLHQWNAKRARQRVVAPRREVRGQHRGLLGRQRASPARPRPRPSAARRSWSAWPRFCLRRKRLPDIRSGGGGPDRFALRPGRLSQAAQPPPGNHRARACRRAVAGPVVRVARVFMLFIVSFWDAACDDRQFAWEMQPRMA